MSNAIPEWKTAVIVSDVGKDHLAELKNALFYSDEVIFVPLVLPSITLMTRLAIHIINNELYKNEKILSTILQSHPVKSRFDRFMIFNSITEEVDASGLSSAFKLVSFPTPDIEDVFTRVLDSRGVDNEKLFIDDLQYTHHIFSKIVPQINACFTDCNATRDHLNQVWNPYQAVHLLIEALQRTQILPDIGQLPLEEIAEIKDKTKDVLNPMRAELLRLTEDLREIVKDDLSTEDAITGAKNIIMTRIEPILRETAEHINAEVHNRYLKFLGRLPKYIGIVGLGFLVPSLALDSVKESLGMANEAITLAGRPKATSATVRFALELRVNLEKNKG